MAYPEVLALLPGEEPPVDALLDGVELAVEGVELAVDGVELPLDGVEPEPVAAVPELPPPPEDAAPAANTKRLGSVRSRKSGGYSAQLTQMFDRCHNIMKGKQTRQMPAS